jgi:TonB family protein
MICATAAEAAPSASSVAIVPGRTPLGATPPVPARPLDILDGDYPLVSLLANEEGRTGLNLLIDGTGRVTLAQVARTSGSRRLDRKAIEIATARWAFEPLTGEGVSSAREMRVEVVWKLPLRPADEFDSDGSDTPGRKVWYDEIPTRVILFDEAPERKLPGRSRSSMQSFCQSRPELDAPIQVNADDRDDRVRVKQWFHISPDGTVDDVLVETSKAWMHLSAALVGEANRSPAMRAAVENANGQSCWFTTETWLNSK